MSLLITFLSLLLTIAVVYVAIAGLIFFVLLKMYESEKDYSIQRMSIKDLENISMLWLYHLLRTIIYGPFYLMKRYLQ